MVSCSVEARSSSRVCGEVCRNPSHDDARVRWTEPGIARKPIRPTPPVMRADRTRWARWWRNVLWGLNKWKDFNVLTTEVGPSRSVEVHAPYHRPNGLQPRDLFEVPLRKVLGASDEQH